MDKIDEEPSQKVAHLNKQSSIRANKLFDFLSPNWIRDSSNSTDVVNVSEEEEEEEVDEDRGHEIIKEEDEIKKDLTSLGSSNAAKTDKVTTDTQIETIPAQVSVLEGPAMQQMNNISSWKFDRSENSVFASIMQLIRSTGETISKTQLLQLVEAEVQLGSIEPFEADILIERLSQERGEDTLESQFRLILSMNKVTEHMYNPREDRDIVQQAKQSEDFVYLKQEDIISWIETQDKRILEETGHGDNIEIQNILESVRKRTIESLAGISTKEL